MSNYNSSIFVPGLSVPVERTDAVDTGIDKKALFEKIYSANLQRVIFFARGYLGDMSEAQNVAHDVFASFWKKMDDIDTERSVAYLYEAAKNSCLNILRKKLNANKYADSSIKEMADFLNYTALENSYSPKLYEVDVEAIIGKGMSMMKPKVRRTFVMSRFQGIKNKDIAAIENVAESTIEARITSALLIMKRLLKDYIN
ncbi:MAG: sigma-70 family RNA polymerase sigma factor [Bacteroidales bacterium]|jgi:RNA polymerase sigma-70 factor (ECF subfamily)|nr:sigma-70 family RNA polymerase sigma factor [Bacteroidales bacterium]MCI1733469.1 sigma-70 family RNA polymerase sigma factor [Bacteroidales bacterium]